MELPDFDEMDQLARQAAAARANVKLLERVEDVLAATFLQKALVTTNVFWINGRPPNQTVLNKMIAKIGLSDSDKVQMEDVAVKISEAYRQWTEATERLQTCRDKISVFQTESANKRFTRV